MKYGALGYLNPKNFNEKHKASKFQETIERVISNHEKNPIVKHHKEKYGGQFPVWVMTELFTFGMLSYFYSDLHTSDKKEIARQYHTSHKILGSWLQCCTDLRNICAHFERLYYHIFSAVPKGFDPKEKVSNSLWAMMLVIKSLYPFPVQWQRDFMPQIKILMDKYSKDIDLQHLGFPENWHEALKINAWYPMK